MGFFSDRRARLEQQQLDAADQDTILAIAEECLPVAVQTNSYAYQFVNLNKGFHEVRVMADGTVKVTPVNPDGTPIDSELPPLQF